MAEFFAANAAGLRQTPPTLVSHGDYGGVVRGHYDAYTTTGAETTGDTITMGALPPGRRLIGGFLQHGALGAGITATVGDVGDPDRLLTVADVAAAGRKSLTAATGVGYLNATNQPIPVYVTIGGGTAAAGVSLRLCLETLGV